MGNIIEYINATTTLMLTILGLIISLITFIIKFIKCVKEKKRVFNLLNLSEILMPLIEEAEKFINYTKDEKKEYVMVKTLKLLQDNKKRIETNVISEEIDKLVSLTKKVNVNQNNSKELKRLHEGV